MVSVKCLGHDTSVRQHSIKVSIELPVAARHRRDMTEKLLKVMLNPNKQQQPTQYNDLKGKVTDLEFLYPATQKLAGYYVIPSEL